MSATSCLSIAMRTTSHPAYQRRVVSQTETARGLQHRHRVHHSGRHRGLPRRRALHGRWRTHRAALLLSGCVEKSRLVGFDLDTEPFAAAAVDVHGLQFAALELMQHSLSANAKRHGGLVEAESAVGNLGSDPQLLQSVAFTSGTGKSPPAYRAGRAACKQGRRVRYVTTAPGQRTRRSRRRLFVGRYGRLDLLCLDELGYVRIDPRGAELLFQIITEREECASVAIATNLPFSEWGTVFPDPRLLAAIVSRVAFNAHILETGTQSYRLRTSKTTTRRKQAS